MMFFFRVFFSAAVVLINFTLGISSSELPDHYAFGTQEKNGCSFLAWKNFYDYYSRSGDSDLIALLELEKGRKKDLLSTISFYVPDAEKEKYPIYLEGICQQVAYFDSTVRNRLIETYEGTKKTPIGPNPGKAAYWKNFSEPSEGAPYKPASALNVAEYILELFGPTETIKLEKTLYFSQKCHLEVHGRSPLFGDNIEAWALGPVVPEVYKYHRKKIIVKAGSFGCSYFLTSEQQAVIREVVSRFDDVTGWQMMQLSHLEKSWLKAREGIPEGSPSNAIIPIDDIIDL